MEELDYALAETRAFWWWLTQYPSRYQQMKEAVQICRQKEGSTALPDLVACRDACHQLLMAAQEGQFPGLAHYFYQGYVLYCQALLPYAV